MRVILQVTSGPSEGRRIPLQLGEIARFGRSSRADVCFPGDAEMSDVHFELECQAERCLLRDLQSASGTLRNGQVVSEIAIADGDEIVAGQTRLSAQIEGASVRSDDGVGGAIDGPGEEATASEEDAAVEPWSAADYCQRLELEDESISLLQAEQTPEAFWRALVEHKRVEDAVRLLSALLSKRAAVWWAYRCVQDILSDTLSADDKAALDAALVWLNEPTDENRRAAMAAAEITEFHSSPSWVAAAAFWSEGSIAPADLPDVPPDELLTSQGVSAALLMAATQGDAAKIGDRFQRILELGEEVLGDGIPLSVGQSIGVASSVSRTG